MQNRGGIGGIVTMLRPGRAGVQIPAGTRYFSLPTQNLSQLVTPGFFFVGVNRPGREFNHSSISSDDLKNEWTCTSTSPTCLHVVDKENFKFPITDSQRCKLRGANWDERGKGVSVY